MKLVSHSEPRSKVARSADAEEMFTARGEFVPDSRPAPAAAWRQSWAEFLVSVAEMAASVCSSSSAHLTTTLEQPRAAESGPPLVPGPGRNPISQHSMARRLWQDDAINGDDSRSCK